MNALVSQLDSRERPVALHCPAHGGQIAGIVGTPKIGAVGRNVVGLRRYGRERGANHRPATLGLHGPKMGLRVRLVGLEACAVGHLIEAITRQLRPDPDRLEQNVVFCVSPHGNPLSVFYEF